MHHKPFAAGADNAQERGSRRSPRCVQIFCKSLRSRYPPHAEKSMTEHNSCFGGYQHCVAFKWLRTIHARTILVGTYAKIINVPAQSDLITMLKRQM